MNNTTQKLIELCEELWELGQHNDAILTDLYYEQSERLATLRAEAEKPPKGFQEWYDSYPNSIPNNSITYGQIVWNATLRAEAEKPPKDFYTWIHTLRSVDTFTDAELLIAELAFKAGQASREKTPEGFEDAVINRFWSYVNKGNDYECWLWKHAPNSEGYGGF